MTRSERGKQLQQEMLSAKEVFLEAERDWLIAQAAMDDFFEQLDIIVDIIVERPPEATLQPSQASKRSGGRKPGSKNKPKPEATEAVSFVPAQLVASEEETLVSLFDKHNWTSEERAHFISKQQDKSDAALIRAFKEIVET